MAGVYRIFGSELSPYSVKVRSYFRYKSIPHQWIPRNAGNHEEFQKYAKLPLMPLVVTPDGTGVQDSTPIIEHFEALFPQPSIHPSDPALAFLSALIEEYGDEWGNKPMFHYRWFYEADQNSASERIVRQMMPDVSAADLPGAQERVKSRMISRLSFVGSSVQTKDQIEVSFKRQLSILEEHLAARRYLFGACPALADFGLFAQLYECSTDPTPSEILRASVPRTLSWVGRMLDPKKEGEFEPWEALAPTLIPLLRDEIGAVFFPWTTANARALAAGEKKFSLDLGGMPFSQDTQKYHAKSLGVLRARYADVNDKSRLDPVLEETGCYEWLQAQD